MVKHDRANCWKCKKIEGMQAAVDAGVKSTRGQQLADVEFVRHHIKEIQEEFRMKMSTATTAQLIEESSVGQALRQVREKGVDFHLEDKDYFPKQAVRSGRRHTKKSLGERLLPLHGGCVICQNEGRHEAARPHVMEGQE